MAALFPCHSIRAVTDAVVAGMSDDEFKLMILVDGCFLYVQVYSTGNHNNMPQSLVSFFDANQGAIDNDIVLLENQLPWVVIQTLMDLTKERWGARSKLPARKRMETPLSCLAARRHISLLSSNSTKRALFLLTTKGFL